MCLGVFCYHTATIFFLLKGNPTAGSRFSSFSCIFHDKTTGTVTVGHCNVTVTVSLQGGCKQVTKRSTHGRPDTLAPPCNLPTNVVTGWGVTK